MTPTQSDRDAAANLYLALEGRPHNRHDLAEAERHRTGEYDAHPAIIAFAAHRIASTAALTAENAAKDAEIAQLREGLAMVRKNFEAVDGFKDALLNQNTSLRAEIAALKADVARLREILRDLDTHARPTNWDDEDQVGEPGFDCANAWRRLDAALTTPAPADSDVEPVWNDVMNFGVGITKDGKHVPLDDFYAHPPADTRRRALEEAAKVADSIGRPVGASDGSTFTPGTSSQAADAIRKLIDTPTTDHVAITEAQSEVLHKAMLASMDIISHPIAEAVAGEREPFMADNFAALWDDFSDANHVLIEDVTSFLEQCEDAGLAECVPVDDDALDDPFAAERGIEPGGMMWRLTDAGRRRYAAIRKGGSDAA